MVDLCEGGMLEVYPGERILDFDEMLQSWIEALRDRNLSVVKTAT